jgi:hypothetical protein
VQLPDSGHITKLAFTEGGLHKALTLVQQHAYINGHSNIVKLPTPRKRADRFDEPARQGARDILRKMGII